MFSIKDPTYDYQFKLDSNLIFPNLFDLHSDFLGLPINPYLVTANHKNIRGFSKVFSNSVAINGIKLTSDDQGFIQSQATANANALGIGINILDQINTGQGNDNILGIANASGFGMALAVTQSSSTLNNIDSESIASVQVIIDAVGISNLGKINTGQGNDSVIGFAEANGFGIAKSSSQSPSAYGNESSVTLDSESLVILDTLAIGIDNQSKIFTGKGHDIILGMAGTSAVSQAVATTFANNLTETNIDDFEIIDELQTNIARVNGTSNAITETLTDVLGIINHRDIFTGSGNDVVVGIANQKSFSQALAISEAMFFTQDVALAQVDSSSLGISYGHIVGIANQGKINTGLGNDTIVGIALNTTSTLADANADALTSADDSQTKTHAHSFADTSELINIGIDNISGLIETEEGNDNVIGYGVVGIQGGEIYTGAGNDSIIGYGDLVGVEDSKIALGKGDDFFKAAIVHFEPITEKKSRSIKNTTVSGGLGDDVFEIGSFAARVSIDGGLGNDILKLSGDVEDYKITFGSSEYQSITLQDTDSTLILTNIEAIYFDDNSGIFA